MVLRYRETPLAVLRSVAGGRFPPVDVGYVDSAVTYQLPQRARFGSGRGAGRSSSGLGHGGGYTTCTCYACDQTVYRPLLNNDCTRLDGPCGSPPNVADAYL